MHTHRPILALTLPFFVAACADGAAKDEPVDTDVVDTDVVDTDAPDTDAPDTDVPDTDVVDTDAPDTDVVDTDPVDTDVVDPCASAVADCFADGVAVATEGQPSLVAVADIDADGTGDLVYGQYSSVYWSRGDGTGAFNVPAPGGGVSGGQISGTGEGEVFELLVADIDGDGRDDVVARQASGTPWVHLGGGEAVMANAGEGVAYDIAVADLGSGPVGADLVQTSEGWGALSIGGGTPFRANTQQSFLQRTIVELARTSPAFSSILTARVDATPAWWLDLRPVTFSGDTPQIGDVLSSALPAEPLQLLAANLDGDQDDDLILRTATGLLVAFSDGEHGWLAQPGGTFVEVAGAPVLDVVIAADADGDGDVDVLGVDDATDAVTVLRNDGLGGLSVDAIPLAAAAAPNAIATGDLNGDGHTDLVVAAEGGVVVLFAEP